MLYGKIHIEIRKGLHECVFPDSSFFNLHFYLTVIA